MTAWSLVTIGQSVLRAGHNRSSVLVIAACILCNCVTLADKDAKLSETKRKELAKSYADRALALLRQAISKGYQDAASMKKDTLLDPMRSRPEFQKLLDELEAKTKTEGK